MKWKHFLLCREIKNKKETDKKKGAGTNNKYNSHNT